MGKLDEKFVMDMWIIYQTPEACPSDPRYPNRKLAFSNTNRETILIYRPMHNKRAPSSSQPRTDYNACGEQSTFDLTYSGVHMRSLRELPKLTTEDKQKMMGTQVNIPMAYTEDMDPAAEGVPLAWGETKPVILMADFFKDMEFDHIFDTTVGSTAAAIAAFYANVQYDGICYNPFHKIWCEQLMNKAMFAVVADGGARADPDYITKVLHFFGPAVDQGMRILKAAAITGGTGEGDANADDTKDGDPPDGDDTANGLDDGFD
jgi:hypothetical protein